MKQFTTKRPKVEEKKKLSEGAMFAPKSQDLNLLYNHFYRPLFTRLRDSFLSSKHGR